jgi:predicted 2-oxoglutarate/Fe(II)-dependent dioxygenase YbiX
MDKLEDYIMVVENAVTDALCDAILEEYKNSTDWLSSTVGSVGKVDVNVRGAKTIGISQDVVMQKNEKVRRKLDHYLFISAGVASQKYREKHKPHLNISRDCGYDLLWYEPGMGYIEHTDAFSGASREVSCSFSLNDDYEGGEWTFWGGKKKLRVPKGSAILFPSNFMYPHQIMPVTKGNRYSIVTWFS